MESNNDKICNICFLMHHNRICQKKMHHNRKLGHICRHIYRGKSGESNAQKNIVVEKKIGL